MSKKFCLHCFNKYKYSGKEPKCEGFCKIKTVYFMRAVASCGKSYTSLLIAGKKGRVIETDSYFGKPGKKFHFKNSKKKEARAWVFKQLKKEIKKGTTTIVIDRGNNLASFPRKMMEYAIEKGYRIELAEPISRSWTEIKFELKKKPFSNYKLKDWSVKLAEVNEKTHHVKADRIYKRLIAYNPYLTIKDFLEHGNKKK